MTHMYLQEKLDGELGNFKLQRRNDRVGYNAAMSPFIALNTSAEDLTNVRSGNNENNKPDVNRASPLSALLSQD